MIPASGTTLLKFYPDLQVSELLFAVNNEEWAKSSTTVYVPNAWWAHNLIKESYIAATLKNVSRVTSETIYIIYHW